jgi:hypothetical protein
MKKFDSVEDLKADWKRIDRALIPPNLLVSMPQPECKGLTMLTDVMINATVCKLGPRAGQITAPYSDGIEIVLDVAETIEHRMRGREFGRHLETSVRSLETGASIEVCIVATGYQGAPAIDDCVSFVLWAETGFFEPPITLDDRILYVRDPELYERQQAAREAKRKIEQRIKDLRRELAREESLARSEAMSNIMLERERVRNLSWRELIAEHESTASPDDNISSALYDLRISLLSMPAPGHTIGHTLERREPKEDSK